MVSDDGAGIPPEELTQVFERFYRCRSGQNGIGLSLARELVLLHGGHISAHNDGGAHFVIRLPLNARGRVAQVFTRN